MQEHVAVDLQSDDVLPGDIYVLCSDGLSGMIDDADISASPGNTAISKEVCRKLVALANEHGGEDTITALVVRIEAEPGDEPGISLSDTLPTPLSLRASRPADGTSETPPAGVTGPEGSGEPPNRLESLHAAVGVKARSHSSQNSSTIVPEAPHAVEGAAFITGQLHEP